jgi:hypothetical protein
MKVGKTGLVIKIMFLILTPYPDFDVKGFHDMQIKGVKMIMHHETSGSVQLRTSHGWQSISL